MLASIPSSILNQTPGVLGILDRFRRTRSRSSYSLRSVAVRPLRRESGTGMTRKMPGLRFLSDSKVIPRTAKSMRRGVWRSGPLSTGVRFD
jgi:hypothetical protein